MKNIIRYIFSAAVVVLCTSASHGYELKAHKGTVEGSYNFWMYEPDSAAVEAKPLVMFLHGASLCGHNLERVRHYGTIDAIDRGRHIDAYVVAPQNPGGAWAPAKLRKIVEWAKEQYDVDSTRIYVLGMSLGGYGTLDFVAEYPDQVAAAMAFCGGATSKHLERLGEVPLWIVHGTADRAVGVGESDRVVKAIRESESHGERLLYNRVQGMNHGQPARFFYLQDTYDWLFTHSLDQEGRPVTEAFDITGKSKNAYANLNHSAKPKKSKTHAPKKKKSKKRRRSSKRKK